MAKSKSFWGLRRGSAGELTFTRSSKGEQVTRSKITSMKNPMTVGQNVQRMQFAGIAKMRAKLHDIVNHSFEGEQPQITSLSEFVRANLEFSETKQYIQAQTEFMYDACAPIAYKGGAGVPFDAVIADGSLPRRYSEYTNYGGSISIWDSGLRKAKDEATLTWRDLFERQDIQVGDWLTYCILVNDYDGGDPKEMLSLDHWKFTWVRFKVKADAELTQVVSTASIASVFEIVQGGDLVSLAYGMMGIAAPTSDPNGTALGVFLEAGGNLLTYAGIIHSRNQASGAKLRSFCQLLAAGMWIGGGTITNVYKALWADALASWTIGTAYILNGGVESYQMYEVDDFYTYQENNGARPRPVPAQPED